MNWSTGKLRMNGRRELDLRFIPIVGCNSIEAAQHGTAKGIIGVSSTHITQPRLKPIQTVMGPVTKEKHGSISICHRKDGTIAA